MIKTAFILGAGFGKRLNPLTLETPKPLLPIGRTNCLKESIQKLRLFGITRIVINAHHLADQIESFLSSDASITHSIEHEILDSGGGIRHCLPHLGESPIFVINGDILWKDESHNLLDQLHRAWNDKMGALLTLVPSENLPFYEGDGDYFYSETGKVSHRQNRSHAPYVYGGIKLVSPKVYERYSDGLIFSNKKLWDELEREEKLFGYIHNDYWLDIGSFNALDFASHSYFSS